MTYRLMTLLGAAVLALQATQSTAQAGRNCGMRDQIVEKLANKYGESRQSMGLGANNQVVEVFASTETGTWTITVTAPNGMMCLVASGQAYEPVDEVTPARGSDT